MYKLIKHSGLVILGAIFFVLSSGVVFAQNTLPSDQNSEQDSNPFFSEGSSSATKNKNDDKKKKEKKPLESYLFDDTLHYRNAFAWNVSLSKNQVDIVDIDTNIYMNSVDYDFMKQDVGNAMLGNLGGATYALNYARRYSTTSSFSMANAYKDYFVTPETVKFYNTKTIYTLFDYLWGGETSEREENFGITHAQNINASTGFHLEYDSRGTRGDYTWQVARAKSLSLGVSHTGKRYSVHAGYIYNSIDVKENGGIEDASYVTDSLYEITKNIPVNLEDARNLIKNNTYYLVQSYGVPLSGMTQYDFSIADKTTLYFGHSTEYSRMYRKYTDTYDNVNNDFYKNWYIYPTMSSDSTFESKLSNKLFVQFQPYSRNGVVGLIDVGAGIDLHHYYYFDLSQYYTGNLDGDNFTSYYVYGSIEGKIKKFLSWSADLTYHPIGYKSQDLSFGANINFTPKIKGHTFSLDASISQELRSPDYWSENYFSNHYKWSNSFDKENETRLSVSLRSPSLGIDFGVEQSVITNKIYYGEDCTPKQFGETMSVSGIYLNKDFQFYGIHLNHRVLLQWSSAEEVISVPLASAYLSYYYQFDVVKNVLTLQLGADCRYNTKYYASGYNPSTAQFYNQREELVGDYPMIDVFVSAKWKRMRILLKYAHLFEDVIESRNYFSVYNYPLNERVLKFGISWGFYD